MPVTANGMGISREAIGATMFSSFVSSVTVVNLFCPWTGWCCRLVYLILQLLPTEIYYKSRVVTIVENLICVGQA